MMARGVVKQGSLIFDAHFGLDDFGVFVLTILDRKYLVHLQREFAAHLGVGIGGFRVTGVHVVG